METVQKERGLNWRLIAWSMAGLLLLLPLVAMQFSNQVAWSLGDFLIFGAMLGGAGLALELAYRKAGSSSYKVGVGLAVLAAFLLIWINGAVGIIGNEGNAANQIFTGVLGVALLGAIIARFEAKGMAVAMASAAGAQVLAFVIALALGWGFTGPITLVFTALWLGSAQMFRRAAQEASAE
ncbi:MAG: hypothetical protein ACI9W4_002078 [Rhodothermales bacterium]|jgi:hypothetical protein